MRKLSLIFVGLWACACAEDKPADPLASANGFCDAWADRVCSEDVATTCAFGDETNAVDKCKAAQKDHCLDRVNDDLYTGRGARECLDEVGEALNDGQLNPREYRVLMEFARPCDELLSGPGESGDACNAEIDCNSLKGFACVKKTGASDGECQKPDYVSGGRKCNTDNAVCEQGFFCDGTNCIAKLESGEACDAENPCADEFICSAAGDGGVSRCVGKIEVGEKDENDQAVRCASNNECASGLCSKVEDLETGLCVTAVVLTANATFCSSLR